jgi:hypothetical protein
MNVLNRWRANGLDAAAGEARPVRRPARAARPQLEPCENRSLLSLALPVGPVKGAIPVESSIVPLAQTQTWYQIGGPAGNIYAGSFGVVATNPTTGNLYHFRTPGQWALIGGPGRTFAMDVSGHLYGLSPNYSGVYQYVGNGETNRWVKIGGPARNIYAGSFGLVATNPTTGNLYHYLGTPGKWALIGGPGRTFAMGTSGHLYGLSPDSSGVYQYVGNGVTNRWVKIGGPARNIYAGWFGLVATNPTTGNLYHYLGKAGNWALIGGPGRTFAVGTYLYGLTPDLGGVYKYTGNGTNWSWTQIGGPADAIAVSATGAYVVALSPKVHNVWALF